MKTAFFKQQYCSANLAKLSVKFTAKLFWVISNKESDRPVYEKNRIRFALDCKSSGFSIETKFFPASFIINSKF
ncbi:hypothetical protein HF866_02415 [Lactobacillus ruminis]|nr:hypothetical protein [Ligilactobacillus ruminis]